MPTEPTESRPEVYHGRPPEQRWNSMLVKFNLIQGMWKNLREEVENNPNYECVPELQDHLARIDVNLPFEEMLVTMARYMSLNGGTEGLEVPMKKHQAVYSDRR